MPFPDAHDEPTRPYKDNPEMYEQACLRRVMRGLAGLPLIDPRERAPHNIYGVWLEGSYPDTRLVVVASRGEARSRFDFGLWDDEFGRILPDDSNRGGPGDVSSEVMIAVYELNA